MVCFRNCSTLFSLALYSTVLLENLVHRNNTSGSMLGLPIFYTHSSFVTMECKVSASCLSSLGEHSLIFCGISFDGKDTVASRYSFNNAIYSSIQSFIKSDTFQFPKKSMSIPRNFCFPLSLW